MDERLIFYEGHMTTKEREEADCLPVEVCFYQDAENAMEDGLILYMSWPDKGITADISFSLRDLVRFLAYWSNQQGNPLHFGNSISQKRKGFGR